MTNRNEEFSNGRSQDDFDKQFKQIAVGQAGYDALQAHAESFDSLEPIQTAAELSCNSCNGEHELNAVYHPGGNSMHYICPRTGEAEEESNWFDYGPHGTMKNPWDGSTITPDNIKEHLSDPWPNKKSLTWEQWLNT